MIQVLSTFLGFGRSSQPNNSLSKRCGDSATIEEVSNVANISFLEQEDLGQLCSSCLESKKGYKAEIWHDGICDGCEGRDSVGFVTKVALQVIEQSGK